MAVTGVVTNLLNVVTLTRPCMATPTNLLLLGLAVADLLVVTEYIPYAASMLVGGDSLVEAREFALYIITHAHLSQVCHTVRTIHLAKLSWSALGPSVPCHVLLLCIPASYEPYRSDSLKFLCDLVHLPY